jgi:hypothetical protein
LDYQRDRRRERLDRENPNRRRWSRTFVRDDYFAAIKRPIQAYVARLLAADGNVLERQQRVTLELSYKDRELVSLVRDELAPGFPVRERTRPNGCHTSILSITSRQICSDETGTRARKVHKPAGNRIHTLGITGRDAWTVDEWLHAYGALGLARKRLRGHSQSTQPA